MHRKIGRRAIQKIENYLFFSVDIRKTKAYNVTIKTGSLPGGSGFINVCQKKGCCLMKKLVALLLSVLLIACISVPAFATESNQGGNPPVDPHSPTTGSIAIVALAVVACGAGAAFAISNRKSK